MLAAAPAALDGPEELTPEAGEVDPDAEVDGNVDEAADEPLATTAELALVDGLLAGAEFELLDAAEAAGGLPLAATLAAAEF